MMRAPLGGLSGPALRKIGIDFRRVSGAGGLPAVRNPYETRVFLCPKEFGISRNVRNSYRKTEIREQRTGGGGPGEGRWAEEAGGVCGTVVSGLRSGVAMHGGLWLTFGEMARGSDTFPFPQELRCFQCTAGAGGSM